MVASSPLCRSQAIPHYFFSLEDGPPEHDTLGHSLPDEAAAREAAIRFAGEVLRDDPGKLAHGTMRVVVSSQDDRRLFSIVVTLAK